MRLDPVNISARRARALEPRGGNGNGHDLVRDVVLGAAERADAVTAR